MVTLKKPRYEIGQTVYIFNTFVDGLPWLSPIEITAIRITEGDYLYCNQKTTDVRLLFAYREDELYSSKQRAIEEAILFFNESLKEDKELKDGKEN